MKTIYQRGRNDCGVAAIAMLSCGRLTRDAAYDQAREALKWNGSKTKIGQLRVALQELQRPLRAGNMRSTDASKLKQLDGDALILVQIKGRSLLHWMVWDATRKRLIDPETRPVRYKILRQIELAQ